MKQNLHHYKCGITGKSQNVNVDPITDKSEITSVEFDNFSNVLHTKEGEKYIFFANKTDDAGEVLAVHSLKTGARIFIKDANDIGGIDDSFL